MGTLERRRGRSVHYNISYLVQGAEYGTDGAIVLLHDIMGGAFTWKDILPQLAFTKRAVYVIDMLGYGQSDHPWQSDTSIWGHADCLFFLFEQLNLTNIVLVGHGIGGGVVQVLATRLSRERVAALVLIFSWVWMRPLPNCMRMGSMCWHVRDVRLVPPRWLISMRSGSVSILSFLSKMV